MSDQNGKQQTTRRRRSRSYWQSCVCDTDGSRSAIKSWFAPMSDGMTPYKAEILCDVDTDAEKKLRAFMQDGEGKRYQFTRSRGKRETVISMKIIAPKVAAHAAE